MGNIGEWLGLIIVVAILFNGGSGVFGGGSTQAEVQAAINAQSTQMGLRDILLSSANNNYELAQQIMQQNLFNQQQNSTNQLAVVQGFNALQQTLAGISSQLGTCCCDIKTTILQDRYDETLRELAKAQTEAALAAQSQYLLGVMGKWQANPAAAA